MGGCAAELAAQLHHEGTYACGISVASDPPDLPEQRTVGDHAAGIEREHAQKLVRGVGEFDRVPAHGDAALIVIEDEIPDYERLKFSA